MAGIHERIIVLPEGYATNLEEGGANLSVGERQRLCVARALYRDAPVLVLDEPTAALDGATERELGDAIDGLVEDRRHTALMASHRESTVRRVDRVVVLSQGRIVEEGAPADLHDRSGVYRALFVGRGTEA